MQKKFIISIVALTILTVNTLCHRTRGWNKVFGEQDHTNSSAIAKSYGNGYVKTVATKKGAFTEGGGTRGVKGKTCFTKLNNSFGSFSFWNKGPNHKRLRGKKWKSNKYIGGRSFSGGAGNGFMRNGISENGGFAVAKGDYGSFAGSKFNQKIANSGADFGFDLFKPKICKKQRKLCGRQLTERLLFRGKRRCRPKPRSSSNAGLAPS